MKSSESIIKEIVNQMEQELYLSECPINEKDNRFAFDRAVHKLGHKEIVDAWAEEDWSLWEMMWSNHVYSTLRCLND
jgi:hypothetical protein